MGPFNNREVAAAIWLVLFMGWALGKADIRRSLAALVRSFCHVKIIVPVCLMVLYTAAIVALLATVSFWNISLLKDTIVWFCVSAMAMMMRFVTSRDPGNIFRKVLVDNIKVIIVLEFLVNTYTFPLVVELILVPVLTFVAMLGAFADYDKKYSAVSKLIKGLQVVVGFVILGIVVSRAISDLQNLKSLDTFRSIALAPVLCLLFSPFLYAVVLMSKYEQVFLRLNLGREKETKLRRYARRRILAHAGLSLKRLQQLLRNHAADIMRLETEADVDRLLKDARTRESSSVEKREEETEQAVRP
jgi:hypothetical protein